MKPFTSKHMFGASSTAKKSPLKQREVNEPSMARKNLGMAKDTLSPLRPERKRQSSELSALPGKVLTPGPAKAKGGTYKSPLKQTEVSKTSMARKNSRMPKEIPMRQEHKRQTPGSSVLPGEVLRPGRAKGGTYKSPLKQWTREKDKKAAEENPRFSATSAAFDALTGMPQQKQLLETRDSKGGGTIKNDPHLAANLVGQTKDSLRYIGGKRGLDRIAAGKDWSERNKRKDYVYSGKSKEANADEAWKTLSDPNFRIVASGGNSESRAKMAFGKDLYNDMMNAAWEDKNAKLGWKKTPTNTTKATKSTKKTSPAKQLKNTTAVAKNPKAKNYMITTKLVSKKPSPTKMKKC